MHPFDPKTGQIDTSTSGGRFLAADLERAEKEARQLRQKGVDARVVPVIARVVGEEWVVGFDVEVRVP